MKYTIHRALALKKTTEDRIRTTIQEAKFIDIRQGKRGTIDGVPVEKVEQQIKSSYQKIEQLISNYIILKNAILSSNAGIPKDTVVIRVGVQGKEYTMAELISTSDEIYGTRKHPDAFYSLLLSRMKKAYADTVSKINRQHDIVENDIRQYLERSTASDKGMSKEEIQQRSEMFHEDRDYVMVDPLNLKEKIQQLEAEIQAFRTDADATMSEQNALTVIEVDLTAVD